jgi:septal ring factor EnvC (AmiA/AmiB activator)
LEDLVADVGQYSTAKPDVTSRHRTGAPATVLLALVTAITATVVLLPRPAAADQISDLKSQATQISQQLTQEQLQIGAFQQQYSVDSAKVEQDAVTIAHTQDQIAQDQQQIGRDQTRVRAQALAAYVNAGSDASSQIVDTFDTNQQTSLVRTVYRNIAVGTITTSVDLLHTHQQGLQAHQAALAQQQAQDQANKASQAQSLQQAQSTQVQMQAQQAQVTGQLAVAIAQQQAAQQAAAAAAVLAAQNAATAKAQAAASANHAPSTTQAQAQAQAQAPAPTAAPAPAPAPTRAPAPSGNSTDPALNPFLQCVVQHESGGNYGAVSPSGTYMGAFQFSQPSWDEAAQAAGRPDLVGVPPNQASKADQDTMAVTLYSLDGQQPWVDGCS